MVWYLCQVRHVRRASLLFHALSVGPQQVCAIMCQQPQECCGGKRVLCKGLQLFSGKWCLQLYLQQVHGTARCALQVKRPMATRRLTVGPLQFVKHFAASR